MQEEQLVKPQSKNHADAVKKSNPGKEKKKENKSKLNVKVNLPRFPLLRGRRPCRPPEVILLSRTPKRDAVLLHPIMPVSPHLMPSQFSRKAIALKNRQW